MRYEREASLGGSARKDIVVDLHEDSGTISQQAWIYTSGEYA